MFGLFAFAVLTGYLTLVGFVIFLAAAELAFPRGPMLSVRDRIRLLSFAAAFTVIGAVIAVPIAMVEGRMGMRPLFHPGLIGGFLATIVLGDLVYYWYHRAQHAIPALWRVHAVHHSVERMGAGAGFHHWLEAPLKGLAVGVPSFLLWGSGAPVATILLTLHGLYVHSGTRIHFGRFAWIICDNHVHRIHHSLEQRHFDKNFAVVIFAWDWLFGTSYFPARDEWPETGLAEYAEPKSLRQWFVLPRLGRSVEADHAVIDKSARA